MYKYCITRFSAYILFGLCLILSSCGTRAPRVDYRELARAAVRLEMDIDADAIIASTWKWPTGLECPTATGEALTGERTVQALRRLSIKKCTTRNCNAIPTPSGRKTAEKYPSASYRKVTWCSFITDGVNASPIT